MDHRRPACALAALLLAGSARSAAAQAPVHSARPTLGVIGGANFAHTSGDGIVAAKTRIGLAGGVMLRSYFGSVFGVEGDLLYSQKGTISHAVPDFDVTFAFDYVEVPILARLRLPLSGKAEPYLVAGPAFALEIACGVKARGLGLSDGIACDDFGDEADVPFDRTKYDVAGVVGGGIEARVGSHQVMTLELRYERGATDVVEHLNARNRSWSVMLGVAF